MDPQAAAGDIDNLLQREYLSVWRRIFVRFERNGRSAGRWWILCTICALFLGICFENVQADSSFAYLNLSDKTCESGGETGASALHAAKKGMPAQQAYVPENTVQNSHALAPRRTARRTGVRGNFAAVSCILSAGIFLPLFFFRQVFFFFDGLCEVVSNTVILRYIHVQDGEKA